MENRGIYYEATIADYELCDGTIFFSNMETLKHAKIWIDSADRLFLKFLSIKEDDSEGIFEFVKQYGFLGLRLFGGEFPTKYIPGTTHPIKMGEKINQFSFQISLMKAILWFKEEFDDCHDYDEILWHYNFVYLFIQMLYASQKDGEDILFDLVDSNCFYFFHGEIDRASLEQNLCLSDLRDSYREVTLFVIQTFLNQVHPSIGGRQYGQGVDCAWIAESLLSVMYFEIYVFFNDGKMLRRCANSTCGRYFEIYGNDTRKIYCSTRCAQLEAKRKQRKREKAAESLKKP